MITNVLIERKCNWYHSKTKGAAAYATPRYRVSFEMTERELFALLNENTATGYQIKAKSLGMKLTWRIHHDWQELRTMIERERKARK